MSGTVAGGLTYTWYYGVVEATSKEDDTTVKMGGYIWEVESTDDCSDANNCVDTATFGWMEVAIDDSDDVTLSSGATTTCTWTTEIDVENDITSETASCTFA